MSEYGLSVFHDGKRLNLSHASPLMFIDMIEMKKKNEVLGKKWNFRVANRAIVDYSDPRKSYRSLHRKTHVLLIGVITH